MEILCATLLTFHSRSVNDIVGLNCPSPISSEHKEPKGQKSSHPPLYQRKRSPPSIYLQFFNSQRIHLLTSPFSHNIPPPSLLSISVVYTRSTSFPVSLSRGWEEKRLWEWAWHKIRVLKLGKEIKKRGYSDWLTLQTRNLRIPLSSASYFVRTSTCNKNQQF